MVELEEAQRRQIERGSAPSSTEGRGSLSFLRRDRFGVWGQAHRMAHEAPGLCSWPSEKGGRHALEPSGADGASWCTGCLAES